MEGSANTTVHSTRTTPTKVGTHPGNRGDTIVKPRRPLFVTHHSSGGLPPPPNNTPHRANFWPLKPFTSLLLLLMVGGLTYTSPHFTHTHSHTTTYPRWILHDPGDSTTPSRDLICAAQALGNGYTAAGITDTPPVPSGPFKPSDSIGTLPSIQQSSWLRITDISERTNRNEIKKVFAALAATPGDVLGFEVARGKGIHATKNEGSANAFVSRFSESGLRMCARGYISGAPGFRNQTVRIQFKVTPDHHYSRVARFADAEKGLSAAKLDGLLKSVVSKSQDYIALIGQGGNSRDVGRPFADFQSAIVAGATEDQIFKAPVYIQQFPTAFRIDRRELILTQNGGMIIHDSHRVAKKKGDGSYLAKHQMQELCPWSLAVRARSTAMLEWAVDMYNEEYGTSDGRIRAHITQFPMDCYENLGLSVNCVDVDCGPVDMQPADVSRLCIPAGDLGAFECWVQEVEWDNDTSVTCTTLKLSFTSEQDAKAAKAYLHGRSLQGIADRGNAETVLKAEN